MQSFNFLPLINEGPASSFTFCSVLNPPVSKGDGQCDPKPKSQGLMLVPIAGNLVPLTTAVLYAKQARAYLKISSAGFNELMRQGIINRYTHIGGKRPFFLKHELDAYLNSLPRYKMDDREPSPNSEEGSSV